MLYAYHLLLLQPGGGRWTNKRENNDEWARKAKQAIRFSYCVREKFGSFCISRPCFSSEMRSQIRSFRPEYFCANISMQSSLANISVGTFASHLASAAQEFGGTERKEEGSRNSFRKARGLLIAHKKKVMNDIKNVLPPLRARAVAAWARAMRYGCPFGTSFDCHRISLLLSVHLA